MQRFVLLLAIFCWFTGRAFAEPLYPLEVGMYWVYEVDEGETHQVTNRVLSNKTILGQQWFQLNEYGESFWIRNGDGGQVEAANLYDTDAEKVDVIEEILVFKYPFVAGETFDSGGDLVRVEGEKTVTVPAGTYACVSYYVDFGGGEYTRNCVAKGVGVVENEYVSEGLKSVSRLVKHGRDQ
jgi:hypothetical protein